MGVSIVIRCYNEEKYIGRLLNGISQQTEKDIEIIVVDSGSTDATVAIAAQYPIKLLQIRPEDFSFGRSLNLGCEAASKEFIIIPSAHVYPTYRNWISSLIEPFNDPKIGLVYGKQRGDQVTKFSENQVMRKWFPDVSNPDQNNPFCNNANAAIRKSLWEEFKYNEDLTGLEDTDWAKRIMAAEYKVFYCADSEIIHVHDESSKQTYNRYRREAIAMKHIFPRQTFNVLDFVRLLASNIAHDYYDAALSRQLTKNLTGIIKFRLMQFSGALKGFKEQGPVTDNLKQTFYYPNRKVKVDKSNKITHSNNKVDYTTEVSEKYFT